MSEDFPNREFVSTGPLCFYSLFFRSKGSRVFANPILREIRDAELKATDFWGVSDRTMTDAQKTYRQELRDCIATITPEIDSGGFLVMTDFPTYSE